MNAKKLAAKIGCSPSTVYRAIDRLGIDRGELSSADVRRLKKAITPGGRGHWRAGRRRNPDADGQWQRTVIDIERVCQQHHRIGVRSYSALARAVGKSEKQVRRWVRGDTDRDDGRTDRPDVDTQARVRQWLDEQLDAIRDESR